MRKESDCRAFTYSTSMKCDRNTWKETTTIKNIKTVVSRKMPIRKDEDVRGSVRQRQQRQESTAMFHEFIEHLFQRPCPVMKPSEECGSVRNPSSYPSSSLCRHFRREVPC